MITVQMHNKSVCDKTFHTIAITSLRKQNIFIYLTTRKQTKVINSHL